MRFLYKAKFFLWKGFFAVKKLLCCVVLGVVMSAVIGAGYAFGEYYDDNSGDSWEDAYIIDSAEDFELMINRGNYDSGNYYKIGADFEIRRTSNEYRGFHGYLDGQGHTISIYYDVVDVASRLSLFGYVNAIIKNLNVTGSISAKGEDSYVAALASELEEGGIIEYCNVTANIEASYVAGGIVHLNEGTIRNCTFSGNVSLTSNEGALAGGIAASLLNGRVENCTVASGSIISGATGSLVGGIVGAVTIVAGNSPIDYHSAVIDCTSYAVLEGNANYKGGIVGKKTHSDINLTLSGNTWPSRYTEVGDGTSYSTPASPTPSAPVQEYTELPPATIQPADLTADSLDQIAQILSLDGELHTIDTANVSSPEEPTQAMRDYAANDNTNLIGKLGVLTVPSEGWYIFKVTLGDELWELVQS